MLCNTLCDIDRRASGNCSVDVAVRPWSNEQEYSFRTVANIYEYCLPTEDIYNLTLSWSVMRSLSTLESGDNYVSQPTLSIALPYSYVFHKW